MTLDAAKDVVSNLTAADTEGNFNIQFSTLSKYLDSVYGEAQRNKIDFIEKGQDFLKYDYREQSPNAYWTGYFSNFPIIKRKIMQYSDFV